MFTSDLPRPHAIGLFILCATTFMALTTELAPVGLILGIANSFHMEVGHVGLAIGAYAIIVAVCAVPVTRLSHYIDRKTLMVGAAAAYLVCNLICASAPTFWVLCLGRMIGGIAHCITMSMAPAYAARLVPARYKGRAISLAFTGCSIGSVVGMPATATLGDLLGWRYALLVSALFALAGMLLLMFYLPRISSAEEDRQRKAQLPIAGAKLAFYWAIGVTSVLFLAHNLLFSFMAPILVAHGLSRTWLGLVLLIISGTSLVGVWFAGRMVDKRPRQGALIATVAMMIGMLPICISHTPLIGIILGAIIWCAGFCSIVPFVMSGAMATNAVSPDMTSAAINSCCNVGIFLGATIGGQLIALLSIPHLAMVSIVLVITGTCMIVYGRQAFPSTPHSQSA